MKFYPKLRFYCRKGQGSWGLGIHFCNFHDYLNINEGRKAGWLDIQILCFFIGVHWGFSEHEKNK